jgi:hypothetical protein
MTPPPGRAAATSRRVAPVLVAAISLVLAATVGLAAAPATASPAGAAPTGTAQSRADRLEILRQSGFVPSEGVYEATLTWTGPTLDHTLETRVFQPVDDEGDLDQRASARQLNGVELPLTSLPRDPGGNLVLRIPIRSEPLPQGDPARMYLPDPGVYPLQLQITGPDGATAASLSTELIRLPAAGASIEQVPVAVVLAIGGGGLSVEDGVTLLEQYPEVAVTVLLDPAVVAETGADAALVSRLGAAIGDRHLVAMDPVPLDVSALAEIGQLPVYDTVRRSGADQVSRQLGRPAATDVVPMARIPTGNAADHLAVEADVLLVPAGRDEGRLHTAAGDLPVLAPDADLMEALAGPAPEAHDVLARLALRARHGRTRPVLLAAGPGSRVTPEDLAVVLGGLAQPGVVRAAPLSEVVERAGTVLDPSERPQQDLRSTAGLLAATVSDLAAYTAFYVSGPLAPRYLTERVAAALAVDVDPDQRTDRLTSVRRDIQASFDVIRLPEGRTVNLAATTSHLPLAVTSEAAGTRRVRIAFTSDKLTFPGEGGESRLVEIDPGTSSFDFVVESRSIGVFPVDVVVSTPDGSQELTRTRITIRSTAVPGLGLLLAGAALVFLVVWWGLHVVRSRRPVAEVAGPERIA